MLLRAESINEIVGHDYIHLLHSKCCRLFQEDSEALSKLLGWIGAVLSLSESRKGKKANEERCVVLVSYHKLLNSRACGGTLLCKEP